MRYMSLYFECLTLSNLTPTYYTWLYPTPHNVVRRNSTLLYTTLLYSTPRGYSQKIWVGICSPARKPLNLFKTKICNFPYPINDLTKNLIGACFLKAPESFQARKVIFS